ncbi:MAG TPA: hypothetical protein VHL34_06050 [Rhizomicrobium sp.]|nr:hypothetical protein [Rhizomicrobium sp.]
MRTIVSFVVAAGLLAEPALAASSVKAEHGNIVLHDGKAVRRLTTSGHDSAPVLSPDGKRVVFVRNLGGAPLKDCSADASVATPMELWSVGADGAGAKKLLGLANAKDVHQTVCAFTSPQFSSNGQLLYFSTPAWATSGAVHVYDFKSGREHFVTDGDSLSVLSSCMDETYRDALIVMKHKYFAMGGSYDWYWLVSPAGKELGPLGESAGMAKDQCS